MLDQTLELAFPQPAVKGVTLNSFLVLFLEPLQLYSLILRAFQR